MEKLDRVLSALRQEAYRSDPDSHERVTAATISRLSGSPSSRAIRLRLSVVSACAGAAAVIGAFSALVEPGMAEQADSNYGAMSASYALSANALISQGW